jgi:hypothetical protein
MDNQQLRDQLTAELRRQKLPPAYIERLLAEFEDHLTDLQEERDAAMHQARKPEAVPSGNVVEDLSNQTVNIASRIGDPSRLAQFAAMQYRNRSFLGRHPILTFLVLPVPLVVLQVIGFMCAMFLLGTVIDPGAIAEGFNEHDHPLLVGLVLAVFSWAIAVFPPLVSALMMCRVARKNALDWRWSVAACCLVALYCALFVTSWRLATAPGTGQFMMGFSVAWSAQWIAFTFLPKFAVAAGIGALLILRSERLREPEGSDQTSATLRCAA